MHEEFDDKFDLFVRSVMEDAEEEVPSGIWDSIESRLPQKSPATIWWKRLGIVVTACAVIASAFVMIGTFNKKGDITVISQTGSETVAKADILPSTPVTDNIQEYPLEEQTTVVQRKKQISEIEPSYIPQNTGKEASSEKTVATEHILPFETEETTNPSEEQPTDIQESRGEKHTYEQEWSSFLAQEEKDGRHARRISADFLGSFGANDNISNRNQGPDRMTAPTILGNANTGIIESGESFYSIPVTFGIGARLYFTDKFSAGIGINYSILTRSFTGTYQKASSGTIIDKIPNADITHKMSYLGIPVNLYYDILQTDLLRFYTFAGGTVEKCLSSNYKVIGDAGEATFSDSVKGLQWSAALGIGIQFNLSEHMGLYLDPNARYYFDCKQPKNIRTQKPFMFNIEAGIRFNL